MKAEIREAVELEEKINYERRMAKQWVSEVEGMVGDLPTAYTKPCVFTHCLLSKHNFAVIY